MPPAPPRLSIVAPCYNEAAVLPQFHARAVAAARAVVGGDYELILIDDGSRDGSAQMMDDLAAIDPHIVAIHLSRNFGHQIALTAGLDFARGERVLIIDADLQDPPELLADMWALLDEGADVAYGQRTAREGETAFKKLSAAAFYRLLRRLTDVDIPVDTGDFRLASLQVIKALQSMPEQHRFIRGMVAWLGFRQVALPYARQSRAVGETKYPLTKMIRFALDAVTAFSTRPLRLAMLLGALSGLVGLGVAVFAIGAALMHLTVPGWTTILSVVSIFSALQLFTLAVMGEYIGRIYIESKRRPTYVIASVHTHRDRETGGATRRKAQTSPERADQPT